MNSRTDADIHYICVSGRRLSGKTTLIQELLRQSFQREHRYGVVLDPKMHQHTWGPHCWVTNDVEKWLAKWQHPQCKKCNIVWEETSTTLKRDTDKVDVFTAKAGERGHRLIVSCHTRAAMLPVMRDQITEVFLFRQDEDEARDWAKQFGNRQIVEVACALDYGKREFIHVRMGFNGRPVPQRITLR